MSRTAIVSAYVFTATNGTNVSALNSGADWVEQNANTAQLRVNPDANGGTPNEFGNEFSGFADCCWKGTGVGSFTANQYFELTIDGTLSNNDSVGGALLNNGGAFGAFSAYRVYLASTTNGTTNGVFIDRIINGTVVNIGSVLVTGFGAWAAGNKLSCEVVVTAGTPTFQIYQDTGSGPTAYGAPMTDSAAGKLSTGVPGLTGAKSAGLMLGGPWTAGILAISIPFVLSHGSGGSPAVSAPF